VNPNGDSIVFRARFTPLAALAVVALALGCSDNPLAPFEPEVTNATDSFQLQATGVQDLSTTLDYTWRNTGTVANVNHSTTTTSGTAQLMVRAADGSQVYDNSLAPSLNEQTGTGTAGDWTIRLVLTNYSGTLNFRIEKP
jgi:hypothetical protein